MKCSLMACITFSVLTAVSTSTFTASTHASDSKIFEAEGHRSIQVERAEKKPGSRLPLSMHFGVDFIPTPIFSLHPLDHTALMLEDQQAAGQGPAPFRFGVTRDLMVFEDDGQWVDVPTGKLWRIEIRTEHAENARLGIIGMDLPKGAELRMYMRDHLEMIAGPFTDDGPMNNGEVWSFTMPGDTVVVEYFESGKGAGQRGLPFAINEITHGYLPIFKSGTANGAGNCHNHLSCYPEWNDLADAAALVIFSGGYLCSGQLIATSSNDETPYYITANHCIGSQGAASSAEFRFRYERTTCTGSYSNGTAAYGSTLVDEWPSSDNTLLRITGALPSWAYFAGWTTADPPNGTDSTSIHYPSGDHVRISFCDPVSNGVCGSSTNWVGTSWSDGVTEQGSSGSAIYRNSDQKLYGVLTCGASSCGNPSGLDGYGRFSRAYENGFDDYLGSGGTSDDTYEPNDSCNAAISMSNGNYSNLAVLSTSDDWFRFDVSADSTHEVVLDFSNSNGDIDAILYDGCSGAVLASGTSNTNDETLSWTNKTGETVSVYMHIYLDTGTYNQYSMAVNGGGGGGGGECPAGFTADCQGTCFPDGVYIDWQGDSYCDDGSYIPSEYCGYPNYDCNDCPPGVPLYLNCDEFDCDNGDCTGCDGGGGGGGGGECEPGTVVVGDNAVDTTGSQGNTLDLTGFCDPGDFGTDAFLNTAFYDFVAPENGTYTVSTCNQAAWDTRLSVHSGDCAPENVITCLDDTEGCDLFTTTIEFTASAGTLYVIALGGYSAEDYGPATLTVSGGDGGGGGGDPTGACCQDTNCSVITAAACDAAGGVYQGNDSVCQPEVCNPTGACCLSGPAQNCAVTTRLDCEVYEGSFYEGQDCTPNLCGPDDCLGDLNGDGSINGADLTILLGSWDTSGGDLNGDGNTNGPDLTILLGSWGPC